jgi:transposase
VRLQELVKAQQTLIEALEARIVTLEARLNKNPSNSNKPPSSDSPFKQRPSGATKQKTPRKRKGKRYELLDPTSVHHLHPGACSCGNTEFEEMEPFYTHQVIELPKIELSVEHFVLDRAKCPVCGKTVKMTVPHEHRTVFGPRLSASIVELVGAHGDSRRAAQEYLFSVFGLNVSQGAIQKIVDRASNALLPHYETIKGIAHQSSFNNIDETSWKTGKLLHWLWVMANSAVAYFMIHVNRSQEAFEDLIGAWRGLLVSDGYALYCKWEHGRQTCLAHLVRRAKSVSEHPNPEIAKCGSWVLKEIRLLCHMAHEPPSRGEWNIFYARLMRIFRMYRDRQDVVGGLVRHLMKEMACLLTFLQEEGIGPTNNHAERMLRFPVIWRKRSFGTRREKGERFVERILSVRQTCRIQKMRTYPVLVDAFKSFFQGQRPDIAFIHH